MGGPGSGGHNREKTATRAAAPATERPADWPWEDADPPWTRQQIHAYLVDYLIDANLSPEHFGDIIRALARHHWYAELASRAIDAWIPAEDREATPPTVAGINALRLSLTCDEKIASGWRRLGLRAAEHRPPPSNDKPTRPDFRPGSQWSDTPTSSTPKTSAAEA